MNNSGTKNSGTSGVGSDQRLQPHADAVGQRVGNEMVLVHIGTNRVYELNSTGARAWELLSDKLPRSEIETRMLAEFDVDRAVLERELDALFASLHSEDLLCVSHE